MFLYKIKIHEFNFIKELIEIQNVKKYIQKIRQQVFYYVVALKVI